MRTLIFTVGIIIITGFTFSGSKSEDYNSYPNPTGSSPSPKFLDVNLIITNSYALSHCHVAPSNTGNINLESDANIGQDKNLEC